MKSKNNIKAVIFRMILYLPLLILVLILLNVSYNILKLNFFDYDQIYYDILLELNPINGYKENVTVTEKYVEFSNFNSAGIHSPGIKRFNYTEDSNLIFVYGASSVVVPQYNLTFSKYLETNLNKNKNNVDIINFGMDASSSDIIKGRIQATLNNKIKPNLIIIYAGHNDYNRIYQSKINDDLSILKKMVFFKLFGGILEKFAFKHYDFKRESAEGSRIKPIYIPVFTNIDWVIEPELKKFLQKLGVVKFKNQQFKKYNELILDHYSQNIYDIIELVTINKIPMIIITPISNLEAEPFGINEFTSDIYQKGLQEINYKKRIDYLMTARDNEIFSGHMRSKSEMNGFLREINESGVYILDLEKDLIKRNLSFGYGDFYDYVHMRPETHRQIAEILYVYMQQKGLI